jgi:hypothetical protein
MSRNPQKQYAAKINHVKKSMARKKGKVSFVTSSGWLIENMSRTMMK